MMPERVCGDFLLLASLFCVVCFLPLPGLSVEASPDIAVLDSGGAYALPDIVRLTFDEHFPGSSEVRWSQRTWNPNYFDVHFSVDGGIYHAVYSREGNRVQWVRVHAHEPVPEFLTRSISQNFPTASVQGVLEVFRDDLALRVFIVRIEQPGMERREIFFDPQGQQLQHSQLSRIQIAW